jgi:DNA-binding MarR family transcriptional regulator
MSEHDIVGAAAVGAGAGDAAAAGATGTGDATGAATRVAVANELLEQLQRIPRLLHRAHHGGRHRPFRGEEHVFGGEKQWDEHRFGHWHPHHHGHHDHHEHHEHLDFTDRKHPGARSQGRLLRLLLERDGILVKDIVEELDIRPSSASELVAKLEKRGFVRTETDSQDKRAKRVYITEKTDEFAERIKASHSEAAAEVLAALSAEEQEQLLTLLRKIIASLEQRAEGRAASKA